MKIYIYPFLKPIRSMDGEKVAIQVGPKSYEKVCGITLTFNNKLAFLK